MDLDDIAAELYGLAAPAFTAARDARAAELRRDKQRELAAAVKALRRPSAAAEALNRMARVQPGATSQLIALGDQLRTAQARLSGDDLRALGRKRREVIAALAQAVGDLARDDDRPLSSAAEREVTATLEAALAEPSAAAALASGRLTRSLEHSGLGPTDLEGAVGGSDPEGGLASSVPPDASPPATPPPPSEIDTAKVRAMEAAAGEAEAAADEADRALVVAIERTTAAEQAATEARISLRDLEQSVVSARRTLDVASDEAGRLLAEQEQATSSAVRLRRNADVARRQAQEMHPGGRA